MNEILNIKNMEKYYGNRGNITKAVDDISFKVSEGDFIGIMGASGSGKTTLLNCISTIDHVTSGHIMIDGADLTEMSARQLAKFRREKLGFVFQDFNLLDTLTGFENIALALTILKKGVAEIDRRVKEIAERLNIIDVLNKYPYEMSGGQRQRVAAARAVVTDPAMILADEPTGALDSKSSKTLMDTLLDLNENFGSTILMVTHDAYTASYADKILFLKDGKIFNEITKGHDSQKKFYTNIIDITSYLGGDLDSVV